MGRYCELEKIREHRRTDSPITTINSEDFDYLLSEIRRLRKAIEKHKKDVSDYMGGIGIEDWEDFDNEQLWKALEDQ